MSHRLSRGRIGYFDRDNREIGREWFTISVADDGSRTVRATCTMDPERLLRDVTYSLDAQWRPLDAAIRLEIDGRFIGSSWFRFGDNSVECQGLTAGEGRFSQVFEVPRRPDVFAPHPLVCDGWQMAAFDHAGPPIQELCSANPSPRPDGASGPMLGFDAKKLEYLGRDTIEVPAGRFDVEHYAIHSSRSDWPPLLVWVHGPDRLFIRMDWPVVAAERFMLTAIEDLR